MNVNGLTSSTITNAYQSYGTTSAETKTTTKTKTDTSTSGSTSSSANSGVIYEATTSNESTDSTSKYTTNADLIKKLQADSEQKVNQFRTLVQEMLSKQTTSFGQANNIWKVLSSGEFTVDAATKEKAQADIAENGYWGVNQTSDRIIEFATALTGGDPDKIEEMRSAFEKGYKQAEKTWGGSLPEISKKTFDAVMKKFDNLAAQTATSTETV